MTRREWLNMVLGATVAAAVAPLVDLTDATPAFWSQPAVRDALPWRIVFPDGLTYTFTATVLEERLLEGGGAEFRLQPSGPMMLSREVSYPMNFVGDPPREWEQAEMLPSPHAPATVISRNGVPVGELVDIKVPELKRAAIDEMDGYVLGKLKREPVSFTVDFKANG